MDFQSGCFMNNFYNNWQLLINIIYHILLVERESLPISMPNFKQAAQILVKKLQFNPVPLGGGSNYTSKLGIFLGAIVMIFVTIYAIGKFSVMTGPENVVSSSFSYDNDPYQINLQNWNLKMSIYQPQSKSYITAQNLSNSGLIIKFYNLQGQQLQKINSSSPIADPINPSRYLNFDKFQTPFVVSGSNYIFESPSIKQFLIQVSSSATPPSSSFILNLHLQPQWPFLQNPNESPLRIMHYTEKIPLSPSSASASKYQYIYDISGFNLTTDHSLLPSFLPRSLDVSYGASLAGPVNKVFLPNQAKNLLQIYFRRSGLSHEYTRKYNSIDVIFGEIVGVIVLFGLILWVLFRHYNQWGSQEWIIGQIQGRRRNINLLEYFKFYLMCRNRSKKEEKILKEVHQNIIDSFKERNKMKIQIQILNARTAKMQKVLNMQKNELQSRQQIYQRLQEQQNSELFSSSILTQEIEQNLVK